MARDRDAPVDEHYPGPPHRVRDGDNLWYVHPVTDERFLSVTSALERLSKEDLDLRWRPGLTARAAINRLPELITATLTADCNQTNGKCSRSDTRQHDWNVTCADCPCGKCVPCLVKNLTYEHFRESKRATDRGSAFHHWVEDWALNDGDTALTWDMWRAKCGRNTQDAVAAWEEMTRPYTDSFLRFVDDFGLTHHSWLMAEATVINREHMWGGTLDARVQFTYQASTKARELCERIGATAPVLSLDTKTREREADPQFWPDNALQLSAYRRGEAVLLPDGTEEPLRPDDGALVVQVRPDGYGWRIPVTDDVTYAGFLGTLTAAYWLIEHAGASTLVKSHPRQPLPGVESAAPKKRAPRKVAVPQVPSDRAGDLAAATGRGLVDVPLPLADAQPVPSNATLDSMRNRRNYPEDLEIPF